MSSAAARPESLAPRLRGVRVGLRPDLHVSRHLFRGLPAYIIQDPLTLQAQRFDLDDYEILIRLTPEHTLAEIFDALVRAERLRTDDEADYYEFILSLHRLGFLSLPIADEQLLYKRHLARQAVRRREKFAGLLFLRVPLVNPDAFLTRTLALGRLLFSRGFFVLWLLVVAAAALIVARRAAELWQPLGGVLAAENLPLMWATLIGLKVLHEFGHAYACKHFGGHVPEMGVYLILFTPCAYVDATAAWGFSRRSDRLIVSLAGMYVEAFIAALAVFVWAATPPGLLNALAFNVIFLASVITVGFNLNPLMRYDGYYVASDWLEIPNLRQRASEHAQNLLKRVLLGLPAAAPTGDNTPRGLLLGFGFATLAYRMALVFALAALIAAKFHIPGLILAAAFLGGALFRGVSRMLRYLFTAAETAPVRGRAIVVGVAATALLVFVVLLLPVRSQIRVRGQVGRVQEAVVRARLPGFLTQRHVEAGADTPAGAPLISLENETANEQVQELAASAAAARTREQAYRASDPALAQREGQQAARLELEHATRLAQLAGLELTAPLAGAVIQLVPETQMGAYIPAGAPIATLTAGPWLVRAVLRAEEITVAMPQVGGAAQFRPTSTPGAPRTGRIRRVIPAGSRAVGLAALTHVAGGEIAVDPASGTAQEPYFELEIELDPSHDAALVYGATGVAQLDAAPETLGRFAYRRFVRFIDRVLEG